MNGLILGAGRHIVFGEGSNERLQLLFTGIMNWKFHDEVAITPESGGVAAFRGQRKVFAPHDIGTFLNSNFFIYPAL